MMQTIQNNIEPDYRLGAEKFCYWLQGFFEMSDVDALTAKQVKMLKEHLHLVFTHSIVISESAVLQATQGMSGAAGQTHQPIITTIC